MSNPASETNAAVRSVESAHINIIGAIVFYQRSIFPKVKVKVTANGAEHLLRCFRKGLVERKFFGKI